MNKFSLEVAKSELIETLKRWDRGEIDGWNVQDTAESIEQKLISLGLLKPQKETSGDALLIDGALDLTTNANAQQVLPIDSHVIIKFLSASKGAEDSAFEEYKAYWDAIDFKARYSKFEKYWYGNNA